MYPLSHVTCDQLVDKIAGQDIFYREVEVIVSSKLKKSELNDLLGTLLEGVSLDRCEVKVEPAPKGRTETHHGGKSSVKVEITFNSMLLATLYYKPRNVYVDSSIMEFLDRLNSLPEYANRLPGTIDLSVRNFFEPYPFSLWKGVDGVNVPSTVQNTHAHSTQ